MSTFRQVIRYGVVGVLVNGFGYLLYLAVTAMGIPPKLAVSFLYPVAVLVGFLGHARYSFSYGGRFRARLGYFLFAHLTGYSTNLVVLLVLHDRLLWPHQLVQLLATGIVAGELFLLMRYLVFPREEQPKPSTDQR